jgi:hypothetical protein
MFRVFGSTPATDIREAALVPEVRASIIRWINSGQPEHCVLIGGLALGFYTKPRTTTDIDLLMNSTDVDTPEGFKRSREHALIDKITHVELELVTPKLIKIPQALADKVFQTAVAHYHAGKIYKVASLEGMIALKLWSADTQHRRRADEGDVVNLLRTNNHTVWEDMAGWPLEPRHKTRFIELYMDAHSG